MKSFAILAALAALAVAAPSLSDNVQHPLGQHITHTGLDLDLSEHRLIEVEDGSLHLVTELEKINLKVQGVNFFDVTDTRDVFAGVDFRVSSQTYPAPSLHDQVLPVLAKLSTDGPKENLEHFTSFRTRHYRSDTGRESQKWLLSKISEISKEFAPKPLQEHISVTEFLHSWGQNSIIARINGTSTDDRVIIISAHQDSTNMWPWLAAPGADDDGSGSVTILESYRALIASNFRPVRPVEFHWYSAEEGGLLGSQAVAKAYLASDTKVYAMSQFDMTAWVQAGTREEVGVITDFTDDNLTALNKQLVEEYLDIPYVETKCGYACSDHASWRKAGYPSVFTIESTFGNSNHNIHSDRDRYDISDEFSFSHMLEFSKLAVAFAVELGGWSKEN